LVSRTSAIGKYIYNYNFATPACQAVRNRAQLIAAKVDALARMRRDVSILSIACGYLRELAASAAVRSGLISRCVGLDHDPQTIATVNAPGPLHCFEPVAVSVGNVLRGEYRISGTFDLIYSAGLLDYLPDAAVAQLIKILWSSCTVGGTLLLANVTPDNPQLGYLESFMDWVYVLRDEKELARLIRSALGTVIPFQCFREPNGIVVFVEVTKS
jgi:hypothetical protein